MTGADPHCCWWLACTNSDEVTCYYEGFPHSSLVDWADISNNIIYHTVHNNNTADHNLNGSSSPVLTATSLSYGKAKNYISHRIKTPQPIEIKLSMVDYVSEGTRHAKFHANLPKGNFSANGWNIRKNFYLGLAIHIPFFFNAPTGQTP